MKIFRFKQFGIRQDHAAMKVGTDSDLLGALARGGDTVLDIGSGTGVLALMMAQRFENAHIEAVEIDEGAVVDARFNFEASPWGGRLALVHSSFQDYVVSHGQARKFASVVCNPPFFQPGDRCGSDSRNVARHCDTLPFGVLAEGVASLLADEGWFSVILPADVSRRFDVECAFNGLWLCERFEIHTIEGRPSKRHVSVYGRTRIDDPRVEKVFLRNSEGGWSDWFENLMEPFLLYMPKP